MNEEYFDRATRLQDSDDSDDSGNLVIDLGVQNNRLVINTFLVT